MDQSLDLPLPVLTLSRKCLSGQHLLPVIDFFLCFCKESGLYCAWNSFPKQEAECEAGRNFTRNFLRKLQRCLLV